MKFRESLQDGFRVGFAIALAIDRGVERTGRRAVVGRMQPAASQLLDGGGMDRAPEKPGELTHDAQTIALRFRGKLTHAHVLRLRWRSGLTAGWMEIMIRLLLKKVADCLVLQHREPCSVCNALSGRPTNADI
jgi:hypothetical protein